MDLAECVARVLAIEGTCRAHDRFYAKPVGQERETWRSYYQQALEIIDGYGRESPVHSQAMLRQIDLAREQLALRPSLRPNRREK